MYYWKEKKVYEVEEKEKENRIFAFFFDRWFLSFISHTIWSISIRQQWLCSSAEDKIDTSIVLFLVYLYLH
jgi:hypothetical protein